MRVKNPELDKAGTGANFLADSSAAEKTHQVDVRTLLGAFQTRTFVHSPLGGSSYLDIHETDSSSLPPDGNGLDRLGCDIFELLDALTRLGHTPRGNVH